MVCLYNCNTIKNENGERVKETTNRPKIKQQQKVMHVYIINIVWCFCTSYIEGFCNILRLLFQLKHKRVRSAGFIIALTLDK